MCAESVLQTERKDTLGWAGGGSEDGMVYNKEMKTAVGFDSLKPLADFKWLERPILFAGWGV